MIQILFHASEIWPDLVQFARIQPVLTALARSPDKLYTKKALNMITIESKGGFEIGMEIVIKSYLNNLAITEVPTTWKDRYEGTSNFKLWQWLPHYLKWYLLVLVNPQRLFSKRKIKYNEIKKVGY